jgi:CG-1 domain
VNIYNYRENSKSKKYSYNYQHCLPDIIPVSACIRSVFPLIGGSLFLFDRKALRYFRKDGHNWRKKKDGKTVREAHEKLKVPFILVALAPWYYILISWALLE